MNTDDLTVDQIVPGNWGVFDASNKLIKDRPCHAIVRMGLR